MHPAEIFKIAGNYNSKLFPHYGGDDEFSMRIKKYGYSTLVVPNIIVYLKDNKKKNFEKYGIIKVLFFLFSKKSSSNIKNKFLLALKVAPIYSFLSFFIVGILKSIIVFYDNELQNYNLESNNCNFIIFFFYIAYFNLKVSMVLEQIIMQHIINLIWILAVGLHKD